MTERREPTISNYSPGKDEPARTGARPSARSGESRSAAHSPAARPVVVRRSPLAGLAFVIALLAAGAAGYMFWQLQQAQQLLQQADARIADLEGKFALSDDEVAASNETIQAKLKWADSEIRKLWGVSHDTNRKAIEANKEAAAAAAKTAQGAKKAVDTKLAEMNKSLNAEVKLVSDLVDAQQTSIANLESKQREALQDTAKVSDKFASLESSTETLERKVKSNEQAIEAIDAFRRNVNQQLLQLRGGTQ